MWNKLEIWGGESAEASKEKGEISTYQIYSEETIEKRCFFLIMIKTDL
jgi:hypothetical protein